MKTTKYTVGLAAALVAVLGTSILTAWANVLVGIAFGLATAVYSRRQE